MMMMIMMDMMMVSDDSDDDNNDDYEGDGNSDDDDKYKTMTMASDDKCKETWREYCALYLWNQGYPAFDWKKN